MIVCENVGTRDSTHRRDDVLHSCNATLQPNAEKNRSWAFVVGLDPPISPVALPGASNAVVLGNGFDESECTGLAFVSVCGLPEVVMFDEMLLRKTTAYSVFIEVGGRTRHTCQTGSRKADPRQQGEHIKLELELAIKREGHPKERYCKTKLARKNVLAEGVRRMLYLHFHVATRHSQACAVSVVTRHAGLDAVAATQLQVQKPLHL